MALRVRDAAPAVPEVSFIFVVDGPGLEARGLLLAATLARVYGTRPEVARIAYVPEPYVAQISALSARIYARAGVELRPLDVSGRHWKTPYPHGNKILAAAADRRTGVTVFLDTDTLALGDIAGLAALGEGQVGLVPEGTPTWGKAEGRWEKAYGFFGLPLPEARVNLTRRRQRAYWPYFNAGMVAFRQDDRRDGRHFGQLWLETASAFDFGARLPNKRPWLDQITLPLCMARFGFGFQVLPDLYNYSISNERFPRGGDPAEPVAEPLLLHYHRTEFLLASPYAAAGFTALHGLTEPGERAALVRFCAESGLGAAAAIGAWLDPEGDYATGTATAPVPAGKGGDMGDDRGRAGAGPEAGAHLSEAARRMIGSPEAFATPEGARVLRAVIDGRAVYFTIADPDDRIQRKHLRGRFYEPEELAIIAAHFPKGGVFCDVGANVGNHSIFALLMLGASRIIPFEPNPVAYELFLSNMLLNGLADRVEVSTLGYGLSDRKDAPPMRLAPRERNLGATQLVAGAGGEIAVTRGDDLLAGRRVDFLKVDVEGMEREVLRGFEATIAMYRPPIFLEVENANLDEVMAWAERAGYRRGVEGRIFKKNRNILLLPAGPG